MDFNKLYEIIITIYTDCGVTEFPIDCFQVVRKCGYRIKRYSELAQKKKEACMRLSPDACLVKDTLYYQDQNIPERTRFSVMHELGHVFLQTSVEEAADIFSSHILAPRIMIHRSSCRNAEQIHQTFGLSYMASNRALSDYRNWFLNISRSDRRKPSQIELELEAIFYPVQKPQAPCRAAKEPRKKRLTKRQREMDERAAFFQEQRLIYGEEYVFHMLEEQWICGTHL
ncbi:MAG: ImmA/IrrE family metallo-endopeptidase [Clostridium sp.]|nr:ImmA/IrrE family metallo-endopeptidase [Clostridium sp.]